MFNNSSDHSHKTKILVVDDERHIARFLEFILKKEGYDVAVAYSGEQAIEVINRFQPDGLLLDFVLPGMSGLDVINHIRANQAFDNLTIIVLTARSFEDNQGDFLEAGANASCAKPIAPSSLVKILLEFGLPPHKKPIVLTNPETNFEYKRP
ncbi:MAG: response regulator [Acidobacteriota bacterium]